MLKFENTANLTDIIKAYDFEPMPDRPDSYVMGPVLQKGPIYAPITKDGPKVYICDGYTIMCTHDSCGNRVGEEVFVPFEMGFTDFDNRVEVAA
jgi:hypothetical protein